MGTSLGLFREHLGWPEERVSRGWWGLTLLWAPQGSVSHGPANHLSVKLEGRSVTGSPGGDRRSPGAPGGTRACGREGGTFLGPSGLITQRLPRSAAGLVKS